MSALVVRFMFLVQWLSMVIRFLQFLWLLGLIVSEVLYRTFAYVNFKDIFYNHKVKYKMQIYTFT